MNPLLVLVAAGLCPRPYLVFTRCSRMGGRFSVGTILLLLNPLSPHPLRTSLYRRANCTVWRVRGAGDYLTGVPLMQLLSLIPYPIPDSCSEMVKRLGVAIDYTNISKYELDKNEPSLMVLLAYARLAGIPVEQIIDDDKELF